MILFAQRFPWNPPRVSIRHGVFSKAHGPRAHAYVQLGPAYSFLPYIGHELYWMLGDLLPKKP